MTAGLDALMESTPLWWQLGAVADLVIAICYVGIAGAILAPLVRTGQMRSNRLGTATACIFLTCAMHHGGHVLHMLCLPRHRRRRNGTAMRAAFDWPMVIYDFIGAAIAIHYWSLRRTYGTLMHGAKLFDDLKERQRQAVELNDNVVQGLVAAQLALSLDEREMGAEAVADTLAKARAIITDLLGESGTELELGPGDLVRAQPARPATCGRLTCRPRPASLRCGSSWLTTRPRSAPFSGGRSSSTLRCRWSARRANGAEAVDMVCRTAADVILLDLAMPVMDGLQAIPEIRRRSPGTGIVVLSGFDASKMGQRALDLGAHAYLSKGRVPTASCPWSGRSPGGRPSRGGRAARRRRLGRPGGVDRVRLPAQARPRPPADP